MKTNSSYPHPVLGVNRGVLPDLDDQALTLVEAKETLDMFVYTFDLKQENAAITRYITEGNAEYICEVDCSKAFYKKTFASSKPRLIVELGKKDVTGHVDFSFYIATKRTFPRYTQDGFNLDYKDPETRAFPAFYLETGAVLAIFPEWSDNVTLRFNDKPHLSAFIQVSNRKDDIEETEIDLSDNQYIFVRLPDSLFTRFQEYNKNEYKGVYFSSIITQALIKGILNLNRFTGSQWADSIIALFEKTPDKFSGLSLDEPADAVDIALKMMNHKDYKTIHHLLFNSLDKIIED